MTDLEIAKTLRDAAQYIRDHGWTTGWVGERGGPTCAVGALAAVLGLPATSLYPSDDHAALRALVAATGPARGKWSLPNAAAVHTFNDSATAAEVIDLFESVALQHELRALAAEKKRTPPTPRREVVHA